MIQRLKEWAVRATEPWREEMASLDLEWRIFAQAHNLPYKRVRSRGMTLDSMDRLTLYDEKEVDPDYLRELVEVERKRYFNEEK
jgi:hypothetical protein